MLIQTRQRAFKSFGERMPFAPAGLWDRARWYSPDGEDQADEPGSEVLNPDGAFTPGREYEPYNVLLFGKKGVGKTAVATKIAEILDRSYFHPDLGKRRGLRRVASNYFIDFVHARGPLGHQVETIKYMVGGSMQQVRALVPVDPCSPGLFRWLPQFPSWSYHTTIILDEIADLLNSTYAMSRINRDWGALMRQQRHLATEYLAATNMPGAVAQGTILRNIDFMAKVIPHKRTGAAELLVFDMHGIRTGTRHRYAPPPENEYDWRIGITDVKSVLGHYNTHQLIAPAWHDFAGDAIRRQQAGMPTWRTPDRVKLLDQPDLWDAGDVERDEDGKEANW